MEEVEEAEEIRYVDNYILTSSGTKPSLLEVAFDNGKLFWERSEKEPIRVYGRSNGVSYVTVEIDRWKLELPEEGKPTVLVRQTTGSWMELREPCRSYLETMKIVVVAASFLAFAKQNPNATKGDVWRYLRRECGNFKSKPHQKDLIQAFLLCRAVVTSDPKLQESPILIQFYPSFSLKRKPRPQNYNEIGKRPVVNRLRSAVPEARTSGIASRLGADQGRSSSESTSETHRLAEYEASTPAMDCLGGESTPKTHTPTVCEVSPRGEPSMPSTPITRRDAEFEASPLVAAEGEAVPVVTYILNGETDLYSTPSRNEFATEAELPLSRRLTSGKRKAGKSGRRSSRKSRKRSGKGNASGEPDDWIDEPDVCAFCDDGVSKGDKLLCCDGPCMRSFHPTLRSGKYNKCPTLDLTDSAFSVDTWICPNCEAGQHQCFACGKLGNSETSDLQEVFVCASKQCKRFYHPACVARLVIPNIGLEIEQENLAFRIQSMSEPFICPLHNCASCNVEENKADSRLCLIKCRRCPKAWHEQCLPEICRRQLWAVGSKHVMYCGRHTLDPELQTPKRDHIKFPLTNPVGSLISYNETPYQHLVNNIISETSRLVTIESVKKRMSISFDT